MREEKFDGQEQKTIGKEKGSEGEGQIKVQSEKGWQEIGCQEIGQEDREETKDQEISPQEDCKETRGSCV